MYSCTEGDRVPQISGGRGGLASESMQTIRPHAVCHDKPLSYGPERLHPEFPIWCTPKPPVRPIWRWRHYKPALVCLSIACLLTTNYEVLRNEPARALFVVISVHCQPQHPCHRTHYSQEPPPIHKREATFSQGLGATCRCAPAHPGITLAARPLQPVGTPVGGRGVLIGHQS